MNDNFWYASINGSVYNKNRSNNFISTQNIFRKTAWGLLAIPVTQKALGSMTESLKMWRILSNKTNAFNKHVMQQKYLFDCTPRYVSSFKVHIFYALFF